MKINKIVSLVLALSLLNGCSTQNKVETTPTPIATPEVTPTAPTTVYFDDIDLDHLEEIYPNSLYYACKFDEEIVYKIYEINVFTDSERRPHLQGRIPRAPLPGRGLLLLG